MHVLVCDDDASVRGFLSAMFEVDGWDVDAVASGEQCLSHLAARRQPDVIVLDQVMPGLKGTVVADRLRDSGYSRPIVLCSANLRAARKADISRLDLLTVNEVDVQAVVRIAHAAVVDHQRTTPPPATRHRQQWPD